MNGSSFCIKVGSGLGGAIPAWIMGAFGYVANQQQTQSGLAGIMVSFVIVPMVVFALAIIPLMFFGKFEKLQPKIQKDLQAIHDKNEAEA